MKTLGDDEINLADAKGDDSLRGTENSNRSYPGKRPWYRNIILAIVIFLIVTSGTYFYYKAYIYKKPGTQNIVKTEWGEAAFDVPQSQETVNVLALGFDKDGYRTDTMIVVNFNPKTSAVTMISIPRDTLVGVNGRRMKINSVFAIGKFDMTVNAVRKLTGLPIHYYIAVDTAGFRNIIDALGGVYFDVPQNMVYKDPYQGLNINLKKGYQLLNGDKAEQLVRYRHYLMGDLEREEVQKKFIKALIEQKLTLANLSDIPKMKSIYDSLNKYVKSNFGFEDGTKYMGSALKIKSSSFKTYTLPGVPKYINGISYYVYDKSKTLELFKQIMGNDIESKIDLSKGIDIYDIEQIAKETQAEPKPAEGETVQTNNNADTDKIIINDGKDLKTDEETIKTGENDNLPGSENANPTDGSNKTDNTNESLNNSNNNDEQTKSLMDTDLEGFDSKFQHIEMN